jgi:site-specific recombinase XerD
MMTAGTVAPLLQSFFAQHLLCYKRSSPQTIAAYRDTFRLLLAFLKQSCGKEPSQLILEDVDAAAVLAFLNHIETARHNSVRSRNARLAAIRSFFRFLAFREPAHAALVSQVLAIPIKRADRHLVGYLTRPEIEAILAAPDRSCWAGRRDHALLLTLYNTGARVSEIAVLRRSQFTSGPNSLLALHGKGRKDRVIPLWPKTCRVLSVWLAELGTSADGPAFPNARGAPLTRDGVRYILDTAVAMAVQRCPSLGGKNISPHVLRHTTAMHLLQSGVDCSVIALWLGHESLETTHVYVEADLLTKEKALSKLKPPGTPVRRFKPDDALLTFLGSL